MRIKHLLGRARAFKTRSKCCAGCASGMGMGRRRRYKRGGSIRSAAASVGKYIYKQRNKIAAAAALGAAYANHRGNIHSGNIMRSRPLF